MTAGGIPNVPLTGKTSMTVHVAWEAPLEAFLRVWAALGDLPSAQNVIAVGGRDTHTLRVITDSLAALLTEMDYAPALDGADISWSVAEGLVLQLAGPSLHAVPAPRVTDDAAEDGTTEIVRPGLLKRLMGLLRGEVAAVGQARIEGRRVEPADALSEAEIAADPNAPKVLPIRVAGDDSPRIPPRTVSVVIPAHNEESVIGATLRSVLRAYDRRDVFVFCDACTDNTVAICRRYLPAANVIDHTVNIGKSRGLQYMFENYIYPNGYVYVSIIDADTTMEPEFLVETLKVLRNKDVACAVGQVKSRWYAGNLVSVYRTYVYTMWQMFYKRLQSLTNSITIASGCSTTWKTRVLRQLEFDHRMSTEDFSLTMQVHRKRLGKIKYVSSAKVWTQDPFTVMSYRKQSYRWDRAWWESMRKYQVGLKWVGFEKGLPTHLSILDVSTFLLMFDLIVFMISLLVLPLMVVHPIPVDIVFFKVSSRSGALYMLGTHFASVIVSAALVALLARRPRILLYSPAFIFLMYLDTIVSLQALFSTMRRQYRMAQAPAGGKEESVWKSPERREVA